MFQLMALSLTTKVAIALGYTLLIAILSGYGTWKITRDDLNEYKQEALVLVMKQVTEIAKLDTESLKASISKAKEQWERDHVNEVRWFTIKETDHVITAPECTIADDSLRLWNDENRGVDN